MAKQTADQEGALPEAQAGAQDEAQSETPEEEQAFRLSDHLSELRMRLWRCVLGLTVGVCVAMLFWRPLFAIMVRPLFVSMAHAKIPIRLIATNPTEPLWVPMKLALFAGLFLAAPYIFWQVWQFIAPGLYVHERRYAASFVTISALAFLGGAVFCYFVMLPLTYPVLLGMSQGNLAQVNELLGMKVNFNLGPPVVLENLLRAEDVFGFTMRLMLAGAVIFEVPPILVTLSAFGLVTHRTLWRMNRYAIVVCCLVGAIVTPGPDAFSMMVVSVPLIVLYNLSILLAYFVTRRRERRLAQEAAALDVEEA